MTILNAIDDLLKPLPDNSNSFWRCNNNDDRFIFDNIFMIPPVSLLELENKNHTYERQTGSN